MGIPTPEPQKNIWQEKMLEQWGPDDPFLKQWDAYEKPSIVGKGLPGQPLASKIRAETQRLYQQHNSQPELIASGLPNKNHRTDIAFTRSADQNSSTGFSFTQPGGYLPPEQRQAREEERVQVKQAKQKSKYVELSTHKEGYKIIGNNVYGTKEAPQALQREQEYYDQHGEYMPSKYPTRPPKPGEDTTQWPDVTAQVYKSIGNHLNEIQSLRNGDSTPGHILGHSKVVDAFIHKAGNNSNWDLQVNHGLPGQYMDNGVSTDQYARFNGRVVRAGYISNYAYGYLMRQNGVPMINTKDGAINVAKLVGKDSLPEDERQAIIDGWNDSNKALQSP